MREKKKVQAGFGIFTHRCVALTVSLFPTPDMLEPPPVSVVVSVQGCCCFKGKQDDHQTKVQERKGEAKGKSKAGLENNGV